MILFVDNNSGILFIKSVDVIIDDNITTPEEKKKFGTFAKKYNEEYNARQDKLREEEELLLFINIFTKICH